MSVPRERLAEIPLNHNILAAVQSGRGSSFPAYIAVIGLPQPSNLHPPARSNDNTPFMETVSSRGKRGLANVICHSGAQITRARRSLQRRGTDLAWTLGRDPRDRNEMTGRKPNHPSRPPEEEDDIMEEKHTQGTCPLMNCERILVAVDGSTHSFRAVDQAIGMAKICHSTLFFLSVIALYPEMMKLADAVEDSISAETRRVLDEVEEKARQEKVSCETILQIGPEPHKFIVQEAIDRDVGLIVMGTHGRTGLKRLLMGSVAERVLGHAPCAVLVTPA
jgi:nucleotide-binding universal stress UspA family protein